MIGRTSPGLIVACLDDIRAGSRTLEQCQAEHPREADELRQLARIATGIRLDDTPHLDETALARGRAQLLAAISSNGHRPTEAGDVLKEALSYRPRWLTGLGAGLAALAAGGAVVYASQGAPTDSPLYPVRQAVQVVWQAVVPPVPGATPTTPPAAMPQDVSPPHATVVAPPRDRGPAEPGEPPRAADARHDEPGALAPGRGPELRAKPEPETVATIRADVKHSAPSPTPRPSLR
ncbi:MAG TPA: hypothetical protein VF157_07820 [Chloroflexota bacterium]